MESALGDVEGLLGTTDGPVATQVVAVDEKLTLFKDLKKSNLVLIRYNVRMFVYRAIMSTEKRRTFSKICGRFTKYMY